ncbi:MAG: DUF1634 domain-containing protein, partial [Conexivisphaera sp.]
MGLGASSPLNTSTIHVPAIFSGIPSLDTLSFIVLGLVVLIATPVLRVMLGIISFARERDALYVFVSYSSAKASELPGSWPHL